MPLSQIITRHSLTHARNRSFDWQFEAAHGKVYFPERSLLWHFPETVQWTIYENGLNGGPTLEEQYGPSPSNYVISAIRYGPAGVTSASITTVTNKAVISALLLTFNYDAVTSAPESDEVPLFRSYFFFQMTSVVLAFCVMLSAATFISHVSRCGQHSRSLIRYLRRANWIDRHLNEPLFVAQCVFTVVALILNVTVTFDDYFMLYSFIGMVTMATALLFAAHMRSRMVLNELGQEDWKETIRAEAEFRLWLRTRRGSDGGGEGDGGSGSSGGSGVLPNRFSGTAVDGGANGVINGGGEDGGGTAAIATQVEVPSSGRLHGGGLPPLGDVRDIRNSGGSAAAPVQRVVSEGVPPCAHPEVATVDGYGNFGGRGDGGGGGLWRNPKEGGGSDCGAVVLVGS